jgi:hypothetical protein
MGINIIPFCPLSDIEVWTFISSDLIKFNTCPTGNFDGRCNITPNDKGMGGL